ncbi:tRNA(Phe) 7-((3-amino-3-carboxypropyl)-4-demethylwyosine(37)-N(4))-methyltransferase 1 [Nanoarchaeota archaeon]
MNNFDKLKIYHMNKLKEAKENYLADQPIYYLLDYINSLNYFFTTSSCAGRIILLKIPKSGKKFEADFLFKSHYPVNFYYIWDKLLEVYKLYDEKIYFKQEPFILHISSINLEKGYEILELARKAGFKHSGIFLISKDRIMVEIVGNEKIETLVSKNKKLLIDKYYFKELINEANEKLSIVRKRIEKFYKIIVNYYRNY